jgi:aldose 1-epimerase
LIPISGRQFELAYGDLRAVVVEVGGGLRTFDVGVRNLLDGYGADELCRSGRGQVLLPWPNRLDDGTYEFDGERHQLPLDEPEHGNAIHGLVRWAGWTAAEVEPSRVVMTHTVHPRRGYPFRLDVAIEYALSDAGLTVRTTAVNAGPRPCPFGCGAHPYLTLGTPVVDPLVLRVPGQSVLRADERGLPIGRDAVAGDRDFRSARPIGSTVLDHAFTDLERDDDGLARVHVHEPESGAGLTLWVDGAYGYLMVFTGDPLPDVNRRALAVEPMTCPPNAFRTGEAVIRLEPGASFTGSWGLTPSAP